MQRSFKLHVIVLFLFLGNAVFSQQQIPTILGSVDESSLINYSHNFCKYSRNEIFARLGYAFKNKDLDLYFSEQPWYKKDKNATITLSLDQKRYIALFQQIEKQKNPKQYTSGKLDEYPVFIFGKTAYLLPKTYSWALQSSSLPQEYIAAKAIKKCSSEKPILYHPAAGLVVFDYVGSDILACSVLGFKNGKFTFPFSSDGYNLKARINPDNTLSISGTRPSYLCGAFITPFEYVYSDKNTEAVLLPPTQQSYTTSTHITYALEIENKTGTPYKITLPENTKVTITKYINTPNCFFIESELGSGWIYHQPLEGDNSFYRGELCQHFYLVG